MQKAILDSLAREIGELNGKVDAVAKLLAIIIATSPDAREPCLKLISNLASNCDKLDESAQSNGYLAGIKRVAATLQETVNLADLVSRDAPQPGEGHH